MCNLKVIICMAINLKSVDCCKKKFIVPNVIFRVKLIVQLDAWAGDRLSLSL